MAKKILEFVVLLIVVISFIAVVGADNATPEEIQNNLAPLPFWTVIGYCYVGVLISFILPILIGYAKLIKDPAIQAQGIEPYWKILRPYLAIALASLCITFIVIAYSLSQGAEFYQWFIPFLGGYTFDATLQKLK